ncbi:MAG: YidC/Oxa1 family membrane protein insertase [Bacilli bacterium]|jgi:YidC/Oxa1 family membrane protein insertase
MKQKILIIIAILFVFTTGCTTPLKDKNNKMVIYEPTGQRLTKNILCQPQNKEIKETYIKNGIQVDKLPTCDNFRVTTGGYEGLWASFFIKPLAYFVIKIGNIIGNYGVGLIIVSLLIRFIMVPFTKKTAIQSENMKKAKPEIERLEKKYKDAKNKDDMMKKSQELIMIYKKHEINPVYSCLFGIIQLPLIFAFLEAINRIPAIFEDHFLTMQLGTTPYIGLKQGNIIYIITVILIMVLTYYSFKLSNTAYGEEQQKQMKMFMPIMIILITTASFGLPTAIGIYWITSSVVTVAQNLLVKKDRGE